MDGDIKVQWSSVYASAAGVVVSCAHPALSLSLVGPRLRRQRPCTMDDDATSPRTEETSTEQRPVFQHLIAAAEENKAKPVQQLLGLSSS